jgi:hypothetical protein
MRMNKARPIMSGSLIKHRAYLDVQKYKFCNNINICCVDCMRCGILMTEIRSVIMGSCDDRLIENINSSQ